MKTRESHPGCEIAAHTANCPLNIHLISLFLRLLGTYKLERKSLKKCKTTGKFGFGKYLRVNEQEGNMFKYFFLFALLHSVK